MLSLESYLKSFEEFLSTNAKFPTAPQNLYEPCDYLLNLGGKRIRPIVCMMSNEAFGPLSTNAMYAACAIELFHNFTLIHDDIMDAAPLRRNKETVHQKYGLTAGILSGDVMNIWAYKCVEQIEDQYLAKVLRVFNKTAVEVCEGQQLDMDFEKRFDVTIPEYIHMIALKTSVLVAAGFQIGALLNNASEQDAALMYEFGKNLGIAFQLKDDYLDTFGTSNKIGKQIGGDIISNKKTYLAIKALEVANEAQKAQLTTLADETNQETKVAATIELFKTLHIDTVTMNEIEHYNKIAMDALEAISLPKENKQAFYQLAQYLLHRDK